MKVAHLILAHNNPEQLARLVNRLTYASDAIYIHIDLKTDITSFAFIEKIPNVYFITKRITVSWGASNIVEATINGLQQILNSGIDYSYINLLSGSDYPLQPPESMHEFLSANPGKAFMRYKSIKEDWQEAIPRITMYHLNTYHFRGRYVLQRILNQLLPSRSMPGNLVAVGRSQWFTASTDCVAYILSYWKQNPLLRKFIKLTWAPDEFIFQTILYNSEYKKSLVNDDLRYIDWSGKGTSPKIFTSSDINPILATPGKLFARKFDMQNYPETLDMIDQKLNNVLI